MSETRFRRSAFPHPNADHSSPFTAAPGQAQEGINELRGWKQQGASTHAGGPVFARISECVNG